MLEKGLKLTLETSGRPSPLSADTADFIVINDGDRLDPEGEKNTESIYRDFAAEHNSLCALIDLSPFAYENGMPITIDSALEYADGECLPIYEAEGKNLKFQKGSGWVMLPSLEKIKARLELAAELGFLGYSIDVTRAPISHLMMLASLFHLSPSYFSGGI